MGSEMKQFFMTSAWNGGMPKIRISLRFKLLISLMISKITLTFRWLKSESLENFIFDLSDVSDVVIGSLSIGVDLKHDYTEAPTVRFATKHVGFEDFRSKPSKNIKLTKKLK